MKVAIITDTHWGARNDNAAFVDFFDKFYTNVFIPKIKEENIDTILMLGDTFDRRKYTNHVSLHNAKRIYFDPLKDLNINIHMLVGNHDTAYKNTNEVNTPSLLLREYDNINIINDPTTISVDGINICMMPWICSDNHEASLKELKNTPADICMGHFEIAGFAMYRGMESHEGLSKDLFQKFDMVFSGHYHHRSDNGHIFYLGNPYELTWQDYDDPRGFHLFDLQTRQLEFIPNPYKMFHKIHYDDQDKTIDNILQRDFSALKDTFVKLIVKNKTNPYWFDLFVEKLEKTGLVDLQVVEDHLNLNLEADDQIVNEAEDTITILKKYIDSIDIDTDKERLDKLIRSLYDEALSIE